jgi:hypothetical protein
MAMVLAVLELSHGARAQGFMVKPTNIDLTPRPGQTLTMEIGVTNTGGRGEPVKIAAEVSELGQSPEGRWTLPDARMPKGNLAIPHSCRGWTTVTPSAMEIPAMGSMPLTLRVKVPPTARGFYYAALLVHTVPPKQATGIVTVLQLVAPIQVTVQGPPARQRITLSDTGMRFQPRKESVPATTIATMNVGNAGETKGRVSGSIAVSYPSRAAWRRIVELPVDSVMSVPGHDLQLPVDLKRRLPSGKYKLVSTLQVDGRRLGRTEKEIDFQGDPSVKTIAAEVSLAVDPPQVDVKATPGGRRSAVVMVRNPGEDPLQVTCEAVQPPALKGVALGTLIGDSFSCAPWVTVANPTFTLRGGGSQNVRLNVAFPEDAPERASYYADLMIHAAYPDGQPAGDVQTLIWVENAKVSAAPAGAPVKMTLTRQEKDSYVVAAQFANTGNTHYVPTATASVDDAIGSAAVKANLETTSQLVLPLGTPQFSGALDFARVKPGMYLLNAVMTYGDQKTTKQSLPIKVEAKAGRRIVTVVEQSMGKPNPVAARRPVAKRARCGFMAGAAEHGALAGVRRPGRNVTI